jgi:hypothetical protein
MFALEKRKKYNYTLLKTYCDENNIELIKRNWGLNTKSGSITEKKKKWNVIHNL